VSRLAVGQQTALLRAAVEDIAAELAAAEPAPERAGPPSLVVLVGLPASGKSHLARLVAERLGAAIVSSDALRRRLFVAPSYAATESRTVFALVRALARRLLGHGRVVVVDATNLRERDRAPLYAAAREAGAPVVVVRVVAPEPITRERLGRRASRTSTADASEADWAVYRMMRERYEAPARPYLTVDTSEDSDHAVDSVVEAVRRASA
jgi:predicted kinase